MHRLHAVAALLALAACSPEFEAASRVEKLRVLAIRAEPPELDPAGVRTAALTSLVLRGDLAAAPARTTTVLHLACVPLPGQTAPSPCVLLAGLRDPAAFLAAAAQASCAPPAPVPPGEAPPPVLAGVEACAGGSCGPATLSSGEALPPPAVSVPPDLPFAALPASAPQQVLGVEAVVLALALDATPDELAAGASAPCLAARLVARLVDLWPAREHVLSTKRVQIRGPRAVDAPNRNPSLDGILAGALPLDPEAATTLPPGALPLTAIPAAGPDGVPEPFTRLDAAGDPIEATREEWVYSWFSTAGALDDLHTRGGAPERWTVEGAPGTPAKVAVVVRDLRGGTGWVVRDVTVGP
jgi:hypothetical protein